MRQTILLADDSPTIRRLVTQTFADADFKIVEVSNGDAAIKSVEDVQPSLVMADIYMPGKNGYEVCTFIRNHATLNATPVILLVGAFDAFDNDKATQAGATAHITKPFEPGALIELVRLVLSEGAEAKVQEAQREPEQAAALGESQESARELKVEPEPEIAAPPALIEAGPGEEDLLGLGAIFSEASQPESGGISEEDIDRIADRVIQKLSTQVIESIAWDIVPDITEKIVRQELRRVDES